MSKNKLAFFWILIAILVSGHSTVWGGTTITWDANGTTASTTDGAGAWLGANQWYNGTANVTWTSGDTAIFGNGGAGGAVTLASPTTATSLTFNAFTGTYTLGTAAQMLTLNSGITKNSGSGTVSIISPITLGADQTWTNNSSSALNVTGGVNNGGFLLTINNSAAITFNNTANFITGAGGLTKNGTGELILSGAGTTPVHNYSGTTTINGGVVRFFPAASATGTGNLTLNGGILEGYFGDSYVRPLGSGAGQIQILGGTSGFSGQGATGTTFQLGTAGSTLVWGSPFFNPAVFAIQAATANNNGKMTLNNGIDLGGNTRTITTLQTTDGAVTSGGTITGAIIGTGTAGLIKNGPGRLILNGVNTYTGDTTISAGVLQIGTNGSASSLASGTYAGNISIGSGSTFNYQGANQTISGVISGAGSLIKQGGNTLTLSGANTYTGKTSVLGITVAGAGVLSVSSFNSVNGGTPLMASSSLGAPTTVANGTIDLGAQTQSSSDTIRYTGPGETTDRVINFINNNNSSTRKLDASGTGSIRFTSTPTAPGTIGNIELLGTGSGEFVGGLPFTFQNFTKSGTGTWTLGGPVSNFGSYSITAGTLKTGHANSLGFGATITASPGTGNATVTSGATLDLNGTTGINKPITINGTGVGGVGALINSAGTPAGISNGIAGLNVPAVGSGSGFSTLPTVVISSPGGSGTTATATAVSLGLTTASFTIANGGTGFAVGDIVNVTGGGGTGAQFTVATVSGGAITSLTALNSGTGYTTAPTGLAAVAPSAGAGATITGNATNFCVAGLRITNAGSGYTTAPTYTLNGNAATVTPVLSQVVLASNSSVGGAGDSTISAVVSESGGARTLTKIGNGTFTLAGVNTYTGATSIAAGSLAVNGSIATSPTVAVDKGAQLRGTGTVSAVTTTATGTGNPTVWPGTQTTVGGLSADEKLTATSVDLTGNSGGLKVLFNKANDTKQQLELTGTSANTLRIDANSVLTLDFDSAVATNVLIVNITGAGGRINQPFLPANILAGARAPGIDFNVIYRDSTGTQLVDSENPTGGNFASNNPLATGPYNQIYIQGFKTWTWNGSVSGDMGVAANWTPATVPTSGGGTILVFPAIAGAKTLTFNNPVNGTFVANSVSFGDSTGYTINPGTVAGNIVTGLQLTASSAALTPLNCTAGTTVLNLNLNMGNGLAGSNIGVVGAGTTLTINGAPGTALLTPTTRLSVNSGGTLNIAAAIGGGTADVSLTQTGSAITTLSGNNTYSGATTLTGGTLRLGSTTALGTSSLTSVNTGSVLDLNGQVLTTARPISISGTGIGGNGALINSSASPATNTGAVTLASAGSSIVNPTGSGLLTLGAINGSSAFDLTINSSAPVTIGGVIGSNVTTLTKLGAGTLTLSAANTHTGLTTISAGTLAYGASNAIGTGGVTVNGATAVLALGNNQSDSVGTVTVANGGSITGTGTSALTSTGTFELQSGSVSAILAGAGIALNKTTTGTVTLSGANTYTGTTAVDGGTLLVTGSIAAGSAVAVNTGGTLAGSGTVAGTVNVNAGGTLSPGTGGTTINTLSTGPVSYNGTSTYSVDLNGIGPASDRITSTGAVTCAGTLTIASIVNPGMGSVYTIASGTSVSGTFAGLSNGAIFTQQGRLFQILYNATTVTLTDAANGFTVADISVSEAAGTVIITVTRLGSGAGAASVQAGTSNGTATAGADFTTTSSTLNWANGVAGPMTFTVPILEDTIAEGDETFTITLSGSTGGFILDGTATVTITDNEAPPSIAVIDGSVAEAAGTASVTVTLTGTSVQPVTVDLTTTAGTATAGLDFTAATTTVTWLPGQSGPKTVSVPIISDLIDEADETVTLTLSNVSTSAVIGDGNGVLTILDDDIPPAAVNDSFSVGKDTARVLNVLANDGGLANAPVTVSVVTPATTGTLTVNADNTITYTPAAGYLGADSFVYRVTDSVGQTSVATVSITVRPGPVFVSQPTLTPNPALVGALVQASAATDVGTIAWAWGDGTPAGSGASTSHVYAAAGVYTVTVTATSPDGLTVVTTLQIFVGMSLDGGGGIPGGGATPPGVTGILVGGAGAGPKQGGSGKVSCNYVRRDKTYYQGSIGQLGLPATLKQSDLALQFGTLVIGTGVSAASFRFDLDERGRGKSTGLPKIELNVAKKRFKFKAQREDLTALTEVLGGPQQFEKSIEPVTLLVPVTVQVGDKLFLALTFQVRYKQISGKGKGSI